MGMPEFAWYKVEVFKEIGVINTGRVGTRISFKQKVVELGPK